MEKITKYDAAIMGLWWSSNYGSIMTYYSLYKLLEANGYHTVVIDRPGIKPDDPLFRTDGRRFQKEYFPVTPVFELDEMEKLNDYADCFVMGSDQVWNFGICEKYKGAFFLKFAHDDKKKLSYAASFGHPGFFAPPEAVQETKELLRKFDGISVRESDAVQIVKENFDLDAERVLDPVFTVDPKIFDDLMKKSKTAKNPPQEPYICTYILDPTEEKRDAVLHVMQKKGLKAVHMLDGYMEYFKKNKKKMNLDGIVENLQVEDWLYNIYHCDFLITDSCHGASFAILFGKPFICIGNASRGLPRFASLAELFHLESRFIYDADEIYEREDLLSEIDYKEAHEILKRERKASRKWFKEKLDAPVGSGRYKELPKPLWLRIALKIYKPLKPFLNHKIKEKIRQIVRK